MRFLNTNLSVNNFLFKKFYNCHCFQQTAAILKNWNSRISAVVPRIGTKFSMMTRIGSRNPMSSLNFELLKIQDDGRPPSWKFAKRTYLWNGLIDQHKIWHGDAYWPSESNRQLNQFLRWQPSAILDLLYACLDHPRRVVNGLYRCAKIGWNQHCSCEDMRFLLLCEFDLKMPVHCLLGVFLGKMWERVFFAVLSL